MIYLFSKMKDYYRILDIRKEASQRAIFKAFRKEYLSSSGDFVKAQEVFSAYLILSQNSRKYFDILQKRSGDSKRRNQKYLNIITLQSAKADLIFEDLNTRPDQIISVLKKPPFKEAAQGLMAIFLNIADSSFAWAFRLIFISIVIFAVVDNSNTLTYLTSFGLLVFAFILFQKGVMNSRKEKIDQIIKAHT